MTYVCLSLSLALLSYRMQFVPPPAVPDSFITNLLNKSAAAKVRSNVMSRISSSTTTTGAAARAATTTTSLMSASPTRVRVKPSTSVLELGSAPSPNRVARASQATSEGGSNAGAVRVPVEQPSLGWTNARARNATTVETQQKPRISLTPAKRALSELASTRTSPRQQRPLLRPGSTFTSSSTRTREQGDTGRFDGVTSSNSDRNRTASSSIGDTSSSISSLVKRTTRLRAKIEKKTDGTADQPIDLDSDSDADSPAKKAAKEAEPPPPRARAKRRAPRRIQPHWEDVDLATIKSGCITEFMDMVVWIGRLKCHADVFLRNDCIWVCSIRYVVSFSPSKHVDGSVVMSNVGWLLFFFVVGRES